MLDLESIAVEAALESTGEVVPKAASPCQWFEGFAIQIDVVGQDKMAGAKGRGVIDAAELLGRADAIGGLLRAVTSTEGTISTGGTGVAVDGLGDALTRLTKLIGTTGVAATSTMIIIVVGVDTTVAAQCLSGVAGVGADTLLAGLTSVTGIAAASAMLVVFIGVDTTVAAQRFSGVADVGAHTAVAGLSIATGVAATPTV